MSAADGDSTVGVDAGDDPCAISNSEERFGLRVGSIFIILVTSMIGTLAPIILRQASFVPRPVFDFAKYFGSGVIIATAFIHLLAPAFDELGSPCLTGAWNDYDFAPAIAMIAVYFIFFAEVAAYRIGSAKLAKLGVAYSSHHDDVTDAHAHSHAHDQPLGVDTTGPDVPGHVHPTTSRNLRVEEDGHGHHHHATTPLTEKTLDPENGSETDTVNQMPSRAEAMAQLVGVAVLEFGVVLHSIIIGLTLAVNEDFITLFIVIIFHQMFEGLGLGSRLAALPLPHTLRWARYAAAAFYSICTPIGIAVGLGVRSSINTNGVAMNVTSGILDAISAGVLLYTGLVELMAHEIILNPRMMKSGSGKLTYIFCCMMLGSGLMALLGRWA